MNKLKSAFEFIVSSRKRVGIFLFVATLLLSIPLTLSLLNQQQDLRQRASETSLTEEVIFSQPSISANQITETLIGEMHPTNNKFLVRTMPGPNSTSQTVTWDVGQYTGFRPTGSVGDFQRGQNNETDSTTVQIQGATGGVWINSLKTPNASSIIAATPAYWWWNNEPRYKPFETPGSEIGYSFEMKAPTAQRGGEGQTYVVAYFLFKDANNPNNQFWYGAQVFDLRGPVPETIMKDDWENGTGLPIVLSVLNDGSNWVHKTPASSSFQNSTWNDYKFFDFRINENEFKNVLEELKETNSSISTNPADYYLDHMNLNPEVYQGSGGPNNWGNIGMSYKNIKISLYKPEINQLSPAVFKELSTIQSVPSQGENTSQYSPYVIHQPGWESYVMYYCKNTAVDGVYRDRVWRTESFTGGKTNYINDQVVIEGSSNSEDDLSCSPGVTIDENGTWHMYYVVANRSEPLKTYMYHATAAAPGTNWTKLGRVTGLPQGDYFETPTPIIKDGKILLYFVGPEQKLYLAESLDGHNFTNVRKLISPDASHGRVTFANDKYYYFYSANPNSVYDPPNQIYVAESMDGLNFTQGQLLFEAQETGWDSSRIWSPHTLFENEEFQVYYAGSPATTNTGAWWGSNSSIGVRTFDTISDTSTPTLPIQPSATSIPTITPTPSQTRLTLTLSLLGIGSNTATGLNPNPTRISRAVDVQIYDSNNNLVKTVSENASFDYNAYYATIPLGTMTNGQYTVKIRTDNSTYKRIPGIISITNGQIFQTQLVALTPGDLNADNQIDLFDYNIFIECFRSKTCPQKTLSDFNDDGRVEEVDLNILLSGFARRSGD